MIPPGCYNSRVKNSFMYLPFKESNMSEKSLDRRNFVKRSLLASAGAGLGMSSFEEKNLFAQLSDNSGKKSAPTAKSNQMSYGKIKDLKVSRLFCGGNLIGGWAHSRDLMYVSPLVKAYHTDEKV